MSPKPLRVLIGCETSGVVRRAFSKLGHDVWSCDLLPADVGSNRHIRGDIRDVLADGWDLLAVMHPPCTRLCNSGVRWLSVPPPGRTLGDMWAELDEGAALFSACWNAPIERVCVENPVVHKHAKERIHNFRPAAQAVQPWHFGDPAFKATSLSLRNLPKLTPTNLLTPAAAGTDEHIRWSAIHRAPPGPERKFAPKLFRVWRTPWRASEAGWSRAMRICRSSPFREVRENLDVRFAAGVLLSAPEAGGRHRADVVPPREQPEN